MAEVANVRRAGPGWRCFPCPSLFETETGNTIRRRYLECRNESSWRSRSVGSPECFGRFGSSFGRSVGRPGCGFFPGWFGVFGSIAVTSFRCGVRASAQLSKKGASSLSDLAAPSDQRERAIEETLTAGLAAHGAEVYPIAVTAQESHAGSTDRGIARHGGIVEHAGSARGDNFDRRIPDCTR